MINKTATFAVVIILGLILLATSLVAFLFFKKTYEIKTVTHKSETLEYGYNPELSQDVQANLTGVIRTVNEDTSSYIFQLTYPDGTSNKATEEVVVSKINSLAAIQEQPDQTRFALKTITLPEITKHFHSGVTVTFILRKPEILSEIENPENAYEIIIHTYIKP